jgi:hypothetical protein
MEKFFIEQRGVGGCWAAADPPSMGANAMVEPVAEPVSTTKTMVLTRFLSPRNSTSDRLSESKIEEYSAIQKSRCCLD